ncbi:MAG: LamG-like jellyroll fold domain-containing protein, partial [Chloroflexota bacterium]
ESSYSIESIDSVFNTSTDIDTVFVDDSPSVVDVDSALEGPVFGTGADDLRDPNTIDLFGTVTDNRTLGDRFVFDLLDRQGESVSDSRVISITTTNNPSSGTWAETYELPGPQYGQYDVFANIADAVGNEISGTVGTVALDDFGPWADVTIAGDDLSQATIGGTVSDLRYNTVNRVIHFHFEEAAGSTTFVDGTQYQNTATCSGGSCPTAGQAGQHGLAVQFDGIDDSLPVDERLFSLGNGATVMAWVQPTWAAGSNGYNPIILDAENGNDGFSLEIADDYSSMLVRTVTETLSVPIAINPNEWTHLALQIDPAGAWTGYVNGLPTDTISQTFGIAPDLALTIGSDADGSSSFEGLLDEVLVYDYPVGLEVIYDYANPVASSVTTLEYQTREINGSVWPGVDSDGLQIYLALDDQLGSTNLDFTSFTLDDTTASAACDDAFQITDDEKYAQTNFSDETWELIYGYPVSEIPTNDVVFTVDTCPTADVPGQFGTAFNMGLAQTVAISGTEDIDMVDMSVSFWFKSDRNDQNYFFYDLVSKGEDSWSINMGINTSTGVDGRIIFSTPGVERVGGLFESAMATDNEFDDGEWHHVVAMLDGPYKRLYVDGVLEGEQIVFGSLVTNDDPFVMGDDAVSYRGSGTIDELAIFDRGLSEEEIGILASYDPWQPATLDAPGSLFSTWSADLSSELEGLYTIALRGTDSVGNTRVSPLGWHGPIDLKGPELELTYKYLSDGLYQIYCKATDLNITETGWDCPAGEATTDFRNAKDWYVDYFSPVTRTVGLASDAFNAITTAQSIDFTACDLYGNCSTVTATETQDAAGVALTSPVNGTQLTSFDPVEITGVAWADPDRDGLSWFNFPISGDFLYDLNVYVNGEEIASIFYPYSDRVQRDEWSVTWQPEPGVTEFEITVEARSFFDAVQQDPIRMTDPSITIVTAPTLAVTKDLDVNDVDTGDTISYTVVVENNGIRNLEGIAIQDTLPAGVTAVGALSGISETVDLAVGEGVTYTIPVQVTALENETVTNTVTVDHPTFFDTADAVFTVCEGIYTVTSSNLRGVGSIQEGLEKVCPGGTITFDGDYEIILEAVVGSNTLLIDKPMTIDGGGFDVILSTNQRTSDDIFVIDAPGELVEIQNIVVKKLGLAASSALVLLDVSAGSELIFTNVDIVANSVGEFSTTIEQNSLLVNNGDITVVDSRLIAEGNTDVFGLANPNATFFNNGSLKLINTVFQSGIYNTANGEVILTYATVLSDLVNDGSIAANASIFLATGSEDEDALDSCNGSGSFEDLGFNILSNDGSCPVTYTTTQTIDPALFDTILLEEVGTLENFVFYELADNSVALDQIPVNINDCGTAITEDAFGIARPLNGACEIGALEDPSGSALASLTGSIEFVGRGSAPNAQWSVPVEVKLYAVGEITPTYEFSSTTDTSGDFTVAGMLPGEYEVAVKTDTGLQLVQTMTLVVGSNSADFGTVLSGDANGDNEVTLVDFSILSATFNLAEGDPNYDSRADFNGDGEVTALDFSILASNFNVTGEEAGG